jgi:hypothetical protein
MKNRVPKVPRAPGVPGVPEKRSLKRALLVMLLLSGAGCATRYFETPTSSTTPAATPDPATFESQIVRGGSATRAFTLTTAGTIGVTLTSVRPSIVVGLGIGIPRTDGNGCNLSRSVETSAGDSPQVSASADPGSYCVKVFDVGQIDQSASFSVLVTHP